MKTNKIFDKEKIKLLRSFADEGFTMKQTKFDFQLILGNLYSYKELREICDLNNIIFVPRETDPDPELFSSKSFKKFIKTMKGKSVYHVRDKLIEKYGENINMRNIKWYCLKNKIKLKDGY
ncbi:MAG: hypothetical protein KKF56_05210 [Nanoarchaeota archaeon]|nr:hypothetical protein [Nanoarchaeota archaeon]